METIDSDLMSLSQVRSSIGALYNRLDTIIASHGKTSMNLVKANGLIKDADYALETAELAKNQILRQAATQMQGLRNRSGDNILELLSSSGFLY